MPLGTRPKLQVASTHNQCIYTPPCIWGTRTLKVLHVASYSHRTLEDSVKKPQTDPLLPQGKQTRWLRPVRTQTRGGAGRRPTWPRLDPGSSHTEWLQLGRLARSRWVRGAGAGGLCRRSFTSQQQKRGVGPWSSTRFTWKCTPGRGGENAQPPLIPEEGRTRA